MNFSVQLSEKTFGPNRVHVPKDVESGVQREEFFRNPKADKASASTLPSGLFKASEVGARRTHKREENICQQQSYDLAVPTKEKRPYKTSPTDDSML